MRILLEEIIKLHLRASVSLAQRIVGNQKHPLHAAMYTCMSQRTSTRLSYILSPFLRWSWWTDPEKKAIFAKYFYHKHLDFLTFVLILLSSCLASIFMWTIFVRIGITQKPLQHYIALIYLSYHGPGTVLISPLLHGRYA